MDYCDSDVAYLLGLIVARGQLVEESDARRIIIEFPGSTMQVEGIATSFDQPMEIKLGLVDIAFRLRNLLETDIDIIDSGQGTHRLMIRFHRHNMIWRNIRLMLGDTTHFGAFRIPEILLSEATPQQ
jgi:hypothetical protein